MIAADIILLAAAGFFLAYLAGLSLLAAWARFRTAGAPGRARAETSPLRRFAFVVPAHNEEAALPRTVASLRAAAWPKELFDVVVVADNCTDATAETARRAGALVIERTNADLRGKGYALRYCFDRILDPACRSGAAPYDAVVVIDADTTADPGILAEFNRRIGTGARALQSSDMVEPQPGAWSSEITRLGFTLYNHARPLGRSVFGGTAGIRGNGMCFTAGLLREIPWSTYSLNEDLEFGLILLLHGVVVEFAPAAKVLALMPSNARNAESQRARWEGGRFPVMKAYAPKLLARAAAERSFIPFDACVELMTPSFVNLFGAAGLVFAAHLVLGLFAGFGGALGAMTALWGAAVGLGAAHVLVGLAASGADRHLYRAFLHIPRYALWKAALYLKLARRRSSGEWVRTTRDHTGGGSLYERI